MAWPTVTSGQTMLASQYNALSAAIGTWAGNVNAGNYVLANVTAGSGWTLNGQTIAGAATLSGPITCSGGLTLASLLYLNANQQISFAAQFTIANVSGSGLNFNYYTGSAWATSASVAYGSGQWSFSTSVTFNSQITSGGNLLVGGGACSIGTAFIPGGYFWMNFANGANGFWDFNAYVNNAWVNMMRIANGGSGAINLNYPAAFASTVSFNAPQSINFGANWQSYSCPVSASGSMTVTSPSVTDASYCRVGPMVFVRLYVQGSLGGTLSNQVFITLPLPNAGVVQGVSGHVFAGGGAWTAGVAWIEANESRVKLMLSGLANYPAGGFGALMSIVYRCA